MTAKFAEEQKKTILAAPNSIYSPESAGTNKLISQGAKIYLEPAQLLPESYEKRMKTSLETEIHAKSSNRQVAAEQLSLFEQRILERLKIPKDIEQMVDIFDGNMTALLDMLFTMELEGKIKISHGKMISAEI